MLFKDAKGNLVEAQFPLTDPVKFSPQGDGLVHSAPKAEFEELFSPADESNTLKAFDPEEVDFEGAKFKVFYDEPR